MHRFLSQIARILQVNRLMEVAHVIEGALESWDRHQADRQKALLASTVFPESARLSDYNALASPRHDRKRPLLAQCDNAVV